ncbi:MAG: hypothetical protein K1X47_02010 [Cyclobacteriaceae bacterium]|nr:hypothetical protein [Cyclobacteriaceae bacterium]
MKSIQFLLRTWVLVAAAAVVWSCQPPSQPNSSPSAFDPGSKQVTAYITSDTLHNRLAAQPPVAFEQMGQPKETQFCIFVDPSHSYQTLLGIGGAVTDASAESFAKLSAEKQQEFLKAYYSAEGIGYSLVRTTIHSSDFSSGSYTYVADNDSTLKSFDIAHDRTYRLPLLKQILATAGGKITTYASPWSPPAWMKTNNDILHGGKLKPEFYGAWSQYFVKFIRAYEAEGIPLWGISIQNEPMATQTWESCIYTAEEERDFLKNNLGPTLEKEGLGSKKIIAWDHNRDLLFQRASTLLSDPVAARYAWGIGFHWYEDWTGGNQMFENVGRVHDAFPQHNLIFTEGCNIKFDFDGLGDWKLGERYGLSMINDFNNGAVGWTDWNILLDETGGPNHVQNFCFAPVHVDTRKNEIIYTNSYYYIGHFSKFIRPGAKRIAAASSRSQLITTAFQNPDGSIAVVVMNQTNKAVPYYLWINNQAAAMTALPRSIATEIIR